MFLIPGGITELPLVKFFQGANNFELMMAREKTFKLLDPTWNSGPTSLIFYPLLAFRYIFLKLYRSFLFNLRKILFAFMRSFFSSIVYLIFLK